MTKKEFMSRAIVAGMKTTKPLGTVVSMDEYAGTVTVKVPNKKEPVGFPYSKVTLEDCRYSEDDIHEEFRRRAVFDAQCKNRIIDLLALYVGTKKLTIDADDSFAVIWYRKHSEETATVTAIRLDKNHDIYLDVETEYENETDIPQFSAHPHWHGYGFEPISWPDALLTVLGTLNKEEEDDEEEDE